MEANPVALDMPCQTQCQALTFLTMSVHAWPVSAFLPDYLANPPSQAESMHSNCVVMQIPTSPLHLCICDSQRPCSSVLQIFKALSLPSHKTTALHRDL